MLLDLSSGNLLNDRPPIVLNSYLSAGIPMVKGTNYPDMANSSVFTVSMKINVDTDINGLLIRMGAGVFGTIIYILDGELIAVGGAGNYANRIIGHNTALVSHVLEPGIQTITLSANTTQFRLYIEDSLVDIGYVSEERISTQDETNNPWIGGFPTQVSGIGQGFFFEGNQTLDGYPSGRILSVTGYPNEFIPHNIYTRQTTEWLPRHEQSLRLWVDASDVNKINTIIVGSLNNSTSDVDSLISREPRGNTLTGVSGPRAVFGEGQLAEQGEIMATSPRYVRNGLDAEPVLGFHGDILTSPYGMPIFRYFFSGVETSNPRRFSISASDTALNTNSIYTVSILIKPGTHFFFQLTSKFQNFVQAYQNFDLQSGVLGDSGGVGTIESSGIEALEDGWFRIWLSLRTLNTLVPGENRMFLCAVSSPTAPDFEDLAYTAPAPDFYCSAPMLNAGSSPGKVLNEGRLIFNGLNSILTMNSRMGIPAAPDLLVCFLATVPLGTSNSGSFIIGNPTSSTLAGRIGTEYSWRHFNGNSIFGGKQNYNVPELAILQRPENGTHNAGRLSVNGVEQPQLQSDGPNNIPNRVDELFRLGSSVGGTSNDYHEMEVYEFILLESNDDSVRQKIEGYLYHRHEQSFPLPVGHPYKERPPYI